MNKDNNMNQLVLHLNLEIKLQELIVNVKSLWNRFLDS